jgi:hypothetical protein
MTTTPKLTPERFHVYLSDPEAPEADPEGHTITVVWADQLRGELEGSKRRITSKMPMHLATVWVWAAMVRLGLTSDRYEAFQARVVAINDAKTGEAPAADEDPDEVGPTPLPAQPSPSASD